MTISGHIFGNQPVKIDRSTEKRLKIFKKPQNQLKERKVIENLLITDIADKGQVLGKNDQQVVFVDRAVPGDIVDVWVIKGKKNFAEAKVKEIKVFSEFRTTPFCSHFGICGGCKWQNMLYSKQLFYKQKQVSDAMKRIAKMPDLEILEIIPAPKTTFYRNKLEFTFSDKRWLPKEELENKAIVAGNGLGFHIPGRFDKILDIKECFLQAAPSNAIRLFIKEITDKNAFSYFDPVEQKGFLRNLIIRTATSGEIMVIVIFHYEDEERRVALLEHIRLRFSEISSLMFIINPKKNDVYSDLQVHPYSGNNFILERMSNLIFKVGPKSFYQTNAEQALKLYSIASDFAEIRAGDTVYDLYTGTGTIANFVAGMAGKVIGIDYIPEAIADANENSRINNISNTAFFSGDMKDILSTSFFSENGKPDIIIADPPRAGMSVPVVENILHSGASRIVYVSCNPSTQARDMQLLSEKYTATKCQPVDMFPHTHHVENVVLLQLKEDILK